MAISDDKGRTWSASRPIMGAGAIQPSVIPRHDGTLVAYLRDNGGSGHIKISESTDDGQTWGPVTLSELANPGAGIDGVRLANGHFCLVYNDTVARTQQPCRFHLRGRRTILEMDAASRAA